MADASPLWSGVVTGLFALGGSLGAIAITSVATARRDAAQERLEAKKRRAEKFEELVAAIYEAAYWLEGLRDREAFGRDGIPIATSPFAKVQSISSVYFPQFNHQVIEVASAADLYRDWIYRAAKKKDGSSYRQDRNRRRGRCTHALCGEARSITRCPQDVRPRGVSVGRCSIPRRHK